MDLNSNVQVSNSSQKLKEFKLNRQICEDLRKPGCARAGVGIPCVCPPAPFSLPKRLVPRVISGHPSLPGCRGSGVRSGGATACASCRWSASSCGSQSLGLERDSFPERKLWECFCSFPGAVGLGKTNLNTPLCPGSSTATLRKRWEQVGLLLAHGFLLFLLLPPPPPHFSFNFLETLGLLHCLVYGSVCGAEVSLNRFKTF